MEIQFRSNCSGFEKGMGTLQPSEDAELSLSSQSPDEPYVFPVGFCLFVCGEG